MRKKTPSFFTKIQNRILASKQLAKKILENKEYYLRTVNGVIGDTLETKINTLAIKLALYSRDGAIVTNLSTNQKIVILAHGSCSSERDWNFDNRPSTDYGSLLQKELGYTPIYLRYNSGLHISTNGKNLSEILETLILSNPHDLNEIMLIGHSMGGLVFRSACYYATRENKHWINYVKKVFYIGCPHLGTHFERFGNITTNILKIIPSPQTLAIAALFELRSAGIKDMRYGYITDDDWQNQNLNNKRPPLLKKIDHYMICSTLSKITNSTMGHLFGDGMVHPASGMGRELWDTDKIDFLEKHCKILPGIAHYKLQRNKRVYKQIRNWCENVGQKKA